MDEIEMEKNLKSLFSTLLLEGNLKQSTLLNSQLKKEVWEIYQLDKAGRMWSKINYLGGYTSYASLYDLHRRYPPFADLESHLQAYANQFAKKNDWNLKGLRLEMTACWINIMPQFTYHTSHIHPHSVISGTYYLECPKGSAPLRIEDPRMMFYMNSPVKKWNPQAKFSLYHEVLPKPGNFVMFESWLRHEVPPNQSKKPRVSISFNYELSEGD